MTSTAPYDALLLLSFGGPERPEDVVPFLKNVTRGRGVPEERLVEVGEHYYARGGLSPINAENRALAAALTEELARRGHDLPVLWGNRNWAPHVTDVVAHLAAGGARRVVAVPTSAYPSYSSCRQYVEDVVGARAAVGDDAPVVDHVRQYANHPGFVEANARAVVEACAGMPAAALVFVTHSIPEAMSATSGPADRPDGGEYVAWHRDVAGAVAARVAEVTGRSREWTLAYCSRSGPAHQPWLEPDINDHLRDLADAGVRAVVVSPIGFTSDHMEVVHDLDTEAAATADTLGVRFARAATARTDRAFVVALVDLVEERAALARGEQIACPVAAGSPGRVDCAADCCPPMRRPQRTS